MGMFFTGDVYLVHFQRHVCRFWRVIPFLEGLEGKLTGQPANLARFSPTWRGLPMGFP